MKNTPVIIFASSRPKGETFKAVSLVRDELPNIDFIDLTEFKINPYCYENSSKDDDFLPLMKRIIKYPHIIIASPIYWYTVSAQMKIFIDRISDLLSWEKDIGRQLRGKTMSVITSYAIHPDGKNGFENILSNTAEYLGMKYNRCLFFYSGHETMVAATNRKRIEEFVASLN